MRRLSFGCLAVALAVAAGCGGGGPEVPVNGVVTLDDKPVGGASVTFHPEPGTDGFGGTAQTGPDGKFVIVGMKGQPGLVPGKYKVTVRKGQLIKSEGDPEQGGAIIPEIDLKDEFPPIYSDPARTVLSYPVTGDGKPIEIKLESTKKKR